MRKPENSELIQLKLTIGESDKRLDELWQDIEDEATQDQNDQVNCAENSMKKCNVDSLSPHEFEQLAKKMERYTVAAPSEEQTRSLMAALTPIISAIPKPNHTMQTGYSNHTLPKHKSLWKQFITLLLQQVQLFAWMFWIISAVVLAAGALMIPVMNRDFVNPFLALTPIVAAIGMFYALRSFRTPMGELESTFPVSPSEIMIGRLSVILIYNIAVALIASLLLYSFGLTGPLMLFIVSWLVPLCFCTVLTLVAMLKFGSLTGTILSLAIWGAQIVLREILGPFYLISNIGYEYWGVSRVIGFILTLLLLVYVFKVILKQNKGASSDADPA